MYRTITKALAFFFQSRKTENYELLGTPKFSQYPLISEPGLQVKKVKTTYLRTRKEFSKGMPYFIDYKRPIVFNNFDNLVQLLMEGGLY